MLAIWRLLFSVVAVSSVLVAEAFTIKVPAKCISRSLMERRQRINGALTVHGAKSKHEQGDEKEDDRIVTKEMFLREGLLEAPTTASAADIGSDKSSDNSIGSDISSDDVIVKKKRKKGSNNNSQKEYKVMDNRDRLPFSITVQTPDPYTHPDIKKKNAVVSKKTRRDAIEDQITSTVYRATTSNNGKDDGSSSSSGTYDPTTWLGEFSLDKHTTTGDSIILPQSGVEYKVVRHRCLYKYGGGQRFVMVRKILEVKEVGRLLSEQYLQRQWQQSSSSEEQGEGLL
jgi:hypothetical protein